jgi:hypothetical protein
MEIILQNITENNGILHEIQHDTGVSKLNEILSVFSILQELPNPSSVVYLITQLEKAMILGDNDLCIELSKRIFALFGGITFDERRMETMDNFANVYLRRAEQEENDLKQLSQVQQQQEIRAENRNQRELRKAQRVYVVNPPDDPVYSQFAGGQPGPGYQEPPLGEPGSRNSSLVGIGEQGSQYAPSLRGAEYSGYEEVRPAVQYAPSSGGTEYAGFEEVRPEDLGGPEPVSSIIAPKPPSSYSPGELLKSALGLTGTTYTSSQNPLPPPSEDFGVSYSDIMHEGGGAEVSRPKTKEKIKEEVKPTDKEPQRKYKEAANKQTKRDYILDEILKLTNQQLYQFAAEVAQSESRFNSDGSKLKAMDFRIIKEQLAGVSPSTVKIRNALISILGRNNIYDPQNNVNSFGINGLGLKRKSIRGSGIYKPLGDIEVNDRKLEKGILTVRRKSKSNFMDLPSRHVSKNMTNIINKITGGGVPSFEDMQGLSADEKHYLNVLVSKANLQDRLSVPAPSKDQMEKDFHQFEVMKGEILSGNDSQELVKKFKLLMMKLARQKLLPRNEVNELMEDLVSLGY